MYSEEFDGIRHRKMCQGNTNLIINGDANNVTLAFCRILPLLKTKDNLTQQIQSRCTMEHENTYGILSLL